jgi:hypothetical protein
MATRFSAPELSRDIDAARDTRIDPYPGARPAPRSLPTFSSSQAKATPSVPWFFQALLIAAIVVAGAAASLRWMRARSSVALQPTLGTSGVTTSIPSARSASGPRVVIAPAATLDEPNAISVESIPTAAPIETARLLLGKPPTPPTQSALKPQLAVPKIVLEETPNNNAAPLPDNPYKTGSGAAGASWRAKPGF